MVDNSLAGSGVLSKCVNVCRHLCALAEFAGCMAGYPDQPPKELQHTQPEAVNRFCHRLPALDLAVLLHEWGLPLPVHQQNEAAARLCWTCNCGRGAICSALSAGQMAHDATAEVEVEVGVTFRSTATGTFFSF